MTNEEIRLKIQALVDHELEVEEISEVLSLVESNYQLRDEYIRLLKLQKKLKGLSVPEPPEEWFQDMRKRVGRRAFAGLGQVFFFGSYLLLLGYVLYALFSDSSEGLFIKLVVGGVFVGLLSLLGVAVADRVKESKTDRYKGVMK
jgi:hypothetical protein